VVQEFRDKAQLLAQAKRDELHSGGGGGVLQDMKNIGSSTSNNVSHSGSHKDFDSDQENPTSETAHSWDGSEPGAGADNLRSALIAAMLDSSADAKGSAPSASSAGAAVDGADASRRRGGSGSNPETEVPRSDEKGGGGSIGMGIGVGASAAAGDKASGGSAGGSVASGTVGAGPGLGLGAAGPAASVAPMGSSGGLGGGAGGGAGGAPLGGLRPLAGGGGARMTQALPHHIPKLDGLASKMEDIRRTMGEEVGNEAS
jgi:hypothetical protein